MKQYITKVLKSISVFLWTFPVSYIVLAATLFDIPLGNCAKILLSPLYYIIVAVAVMTGYGLWEMKRWSWYWFLAMQSLVFIGNINYVVNYSESHHKIFALVISVILQTILFLRVEREVCVPYLFPKIRWWESNPRLRLSCQVSIIRKNGEAHEGEIVDLSLAGCFIKLRQDFILDESIQLKFTLFKYEMDCDGLVVWLAQSAVTHPKGIGVKFGFLQKAQKKNLKIIQKRIKKIAHFYRSARYLMSQDEFIKQLEILENSEPSLRKHDK